MNVAYPSLPALQNIRKERVDSVHSILWRAVAPAVPMRPDVCERSPVTGGLSSGGDKGGYSGYKSDNRSGQASVDFELFACVQCQIMSRISTRSAMSVTRKKFTNL
jgi:hypothetical protein